MQGFIILSLVAVLAIIGWMDSSAWAGNQSTPEAREVSTPHEHYWVIEVGGKEIKHGGYTKLHRSGQKIVEGRYDHGQKDGRWVYRAVGGEIVKEAHYAKGLKDGLWTEWNAKGIKSFKGRFQNDRPVGTHHSWHLEGALKSETKHMLRGDDLLAVQSAWHPGGQRYTESELLNGKLHGKHRAWHLNGSARIECNHVDGQRHGLYREWYDNGQLKAEYTYDHGRKAGRSTEWYANGQKSAEGQYTNGKDGVWTEWEKSGDIRSQRRYQNGKVLKQ